TVRENVHARKTANGRTDLFSLRRQRLLLLLHLFLFLGTQTAHKGLLVRHGHPSRARLIKNPLRENRQREKEIRVRKIDLQPFRTDNGRNSFSSQMRAKAVAKRWFSVCVRGLTRRRTSEGDGWLSKE